MLTDKTKIVVFDIDSRRYSISTMDDRTVNQTPVCTVAHFFDTVCRLFEHIHPNMGANPMYQAVPWDRLETEGEISLDPDPESEQNGVLS